MDTPRRKEKLLTVEEAAAMIQDGMTIAIGGFISANHPMALVRQIIKNGTRDLRVIGAGSSGLELDMLIAAGCVRHLHSPYVSAEYLAPIGWAFRRAGETGAIEIHECSEGVLYSGLRAAALGLPFMPVKSGVGTDLPKLNPEIQEFEDPLQGEKLLAVPRLKPHIALIHVQRADPYGNGQHLGSAHADRLMADAADWVILCADRIVSNEVIRRSMHFTSIAYANHVVETPFGCHPFASHGEYAEDLEHLQEYVRAAESFYRGNPSSIREYFEKYALAPQTHEDYLEAIGLKKLLALRRAYRFTVL